ncbi:nitroreductase/quinone reductase family protein [Nocardia takedensis]|uniref:nitroreductase/quinone reductase family protein n=1 Tax=Nocardia takedensis TaxID=259390 RepID=UPI000594B1D3|nr:nitroreductase/quinone reductase family protein [Nocardia takedensis]
MALSPAAQSFNKRILHPVMVTALRLGIAPPTFALLETTGRRTGKRRQVPVANGIDGDTFWLIAGLGEKSPFVRNIEADPRIRVKVKPARFRDGLLPRWRTGTATPLPEDDSLARHRTLGVGRPGYRADGVLLRKLAEGGRLLTVRVDLD